MNDILQRRQQCLLPDGHNRCQAVTLWRRGGSIAAGLHPLWAVSDDLYSIKPAGNSKDAPLDNRLMIVAQKSLNRDQPAKQIPLGCRLFPCAIRFLFPITFSILSRPDEKCVPSVVHDPTDNFYNLIFMSF